MQYPRESQNDDIPSNQPLYYRYTKTAPVIPGEAPHEACLIEIHIFVCEKRDPPGYTKDPSMSVPTTLPPFCSWASALLSLYVY
jgi:hypothetical protein